MATITEMKEAINELINSEGTIELPGLEYKTIVDNIIEVKFKKQLDNAKIYNDRDNVKKELLRYYDEHVKEEIEQNINIIKSNFAAVKDGLKYVSESVTNAVASNAIPSVITTGAAASVANPVYALLENKSKKTVLLGMLKNIGNFLCNLLSSAVKILFQVPDTVIALINTLTTVKKAVNSIPV